MPIGTMFLLPEPELEFRHLQRTADPHVGLSLFGPWDADSDAPGRITYGVIGTPQGIERFVCFAEAIAGPVIARGSDEAARDDVKAELKRIKSSRLWPAFPGFEAAFISTDFRRQLKARALTHRAPIQVVRESTLLLNPEETARDLTCPSDRAWNLATALYYKAGGKPWRLASARPGVCYIGLAFKRQDAKSPNSRNAVCAAQMFLDTGDGVVFRGELGPWYSPDNKHYLVGRKEARSLLEGVLAAYREQDGRPLCEKRSGCPAACGGGE